MSNFEVSEPIINTPFDKPTHFWYIREGYSPEKREGRRPSVVYPPSDTNVEWQLGSDILRASKEFSPGYEMLLVNTIRARLDTWRGQNYPGITRTTRELLEWWKRDGRKFRLFYAQLEAAEAVIFLRDNQIHGRLLSWFDYGEVAIWHLAPRLRVSYDGRRETVYSEAVQAAHRRFYASASDASYARILEADYVWLPHRLPVIAPLVRDGWIEIFRGSRSVVLARTGGTFLHSPPSTGPSCFPGP